jgi:hypothetical protein
MLEALFGWMTGEDQPEAVLDGSRDLAFTRPRK